MLYANRGDICLYVFSRRASPARAFYLEGFPRWHGTRRGEDVTDYLSIKR